MRAIIGRGCGSPPAGWPRAWSAQPSTTWAWARGAWSRLPSRPRPQRAARRRHGHPRMRSR
eukprot:680455-Prymnesium_polylepis.1